jgi:hypothetical protein
MLISYDLAPVIQELIDSHVDYLKHLLRLARASVATLTADELPNWEMG